MTTETPLETYEINWQGIAIQIDYKPICWGITSHLEVRSVLPENAALPITETGYRSHFMPIGTVESQYASTADFVVAWLDARAKSTEWKDQTIKSAQGDLFSDM